MVLELKIIQKEHNNHECHSSDVITRLHTNAHSYTSLKGVRVGENRVKERKGVVCLPDVKLHWTLTVAGPCCHSNRIR